MLTRLATLISLFGPAIAAFAAVLAARASLRAHDVATRSAAWQDNRSRSEEGMRLLRWGVELAVADHDRSIRAGIVVLEALNDARMVVRNDRAFVIKVSQGVTLNVCDHAGYAEDDTFEIPEGGDDA